MTRLGTQGVSHRRMLIANRFLPDHVRSLTELFAPFEHWGSCQTDIWVLYNIPMYICHLPREDLGLSPCNAIAFTSISQRNYCNSQAYCFGKTTCLFPFANSTVSTLGESNCNECSAASRAAAQFLARSLLCAICHTATVPL